MKRNKLLFLIVLVLIVSVFIMGCSDDGKDKVDANITDNIVEKDTDKELPLEVETADKPEDEEDYGIIIDGEEWPTEAMDDIPQLIGKITSASVVTDLRHIKMESVKKKDAENFIKELKALGFTVEPGESNSNTMIVYNAKHEDKRGITFGWSKDKGEVDLIYTLPFKPS